MSQHSIGCICVWCLADNSAFDYTDMPKHESNPKFHALLKQMGEVHDRKNHDYTHGGNPYSNFEEAAATAGCSVDTVFAVLMGVKLSRLNALTREAKEPNHESLKDTRLDLAVYAALWASY